ncbi:hypothetical protein [Natronorubrum halalkaliphilum]|uniref:hypothetical protein n=1 Tax=Natronorubrum halalkaliphilum TaxID=2691917 RepID=UPI001F35EE44|nr:hypothetical protein [Natronorubrum halalkaliphilum]
MMIVLSVVFLVGGPLAVTNGYRIDTAEQRTRANRLWRVWVAMSAFESAVGRLFNLGSDAGDADGLACYRTDGRPAPVALVQWRMHERTEFRGWTDEWFAGRGSSESSLPA